MSVFILSGNSLAYCRSHFSIILSLIGLTPGYSTELKKTDFAHFSPVGPIDGALQGFDAELRAEDVDALLLEEREGEEVGERRSGLVGRLVPTEFGAGLVHPLS